MSLGATPNTHYIPENNFRAGTGARVGLSGVRTNANMRWDPRWEDTLPRPPADPQRSRAETLVSTEHTETARQLEKRGL